MYSLTDHSITRLTNDRVNDGPSQNAQLICTGVEQLGNQQEAQ